MMATFNRILKTTLTMLAMLKTCSTFNRCFMRNSNKISMRFMCMISEDDARGILYDDLRKWRKAMADEIQKPAYAVLKNADLAAVAESLPTTLDDMKLLPGFGEKKIAAYGIKLLDIVKKRRQAILNAVLTEPRTENSTTYIKPKKISSDTRRSKNEELSVVRKPKSINITKLSPEQLAAAELILEGKNNFFVTGSAGTGKSYLLKYLIHELKVKYGQKGVAVTAPTGIAAINVGGSTLHSFAGIGLGTGDRKTFISKIMAPKGSRLAFNRWKQTKVLIIDEISMLDSTVFELIEDIARTIHNSSLPFGGLQVIVVGDFLQLPPVAVGGAVREFCFESPVWHYAGFNDPMSKVILSTVLRQEDPTFINLLNAARLGFHSDDDAEVLRRCVVSIKPLPVDGIVPTKLYCTNKDVDAENSLRLSEIDEDLVSIVATDVWDKFVNTSEGTKQGKEPAAVLKRHMIDLADKCIPNKIDLKIGAQVVLLRNRANTGPSSDDDVGEGDGDGPSKKLVNGSRGVVIGFAQSKGTLELLPRVRFDCGQVVVIGKADFEIPFPDSSGALVRLQVPLKLAWAMTVHKSQGTTLTRAELMITNAFDYGQAYVALSRVRSLDGLWLTRPLKATSFKAHPAVLAYYGFTS